MDFVPASLRRLAHRFSHSAQARSNSRRSARRRVAAKLSLESLESRRQMAVVDMLEHDYRADSFSISGTFTYQLQSPSNSSYIDTINNGQYSSTSANISWTSPTEGVGFMEGVATGTGRDSVFAVGARRTCSDYSIREEGRFDFNINAATSDLAMNDANATSVTYTSYVDRLGGRCPQPDPPLSRFFGGDPALYDGIFKSFEQTVAVNYAQTGDPAITVNSPATAITWTNTSATDLTMNAGSYYPEPAPPEGWIDLPQTGATNLVSFIDPESGGARIDAAVQGRIMKTATPATPVANVKLFWAASATDTTGAEIPVTPGAEPLGLFWNSNTLTAEIAQLGTPPANATHVRIVVSGPAGTDSNAANSVRFVPLGQFEVANTSTPGAITAGDSFDGSAQSLLAPADASNPNIRVFAFNPITTLGGAANVFDEFGGFSYDTFDAPGIAALAAGETAQDYLEFMAIKDRQLLDRATHTFTVVGVNDPPIANDDTGAASNKTPQSFPISGLLANDSDPDHNDSVEFASVEAFSAYGASVGLRRNIETGEWSSVEYDPRYSLQLLSLNPGEQVVDEIYYSIEDTIGELSFGTLYVTVTGGTQQLTITPLQAQLTRLNSTVGPLDFQVFDPDGDPSDIVVTATSDNPFLFPPSAMQIDGASGNFQITLTPVTDSFGRAKITLQATDGASKNASMSFSILVGSSTDLDLDGITDSIENGAPNAGDMNDDGVPDMEQPHVVSAESPFDNGYLQLLTNEGTTFENTIVRTGALDPAAPAGMSFPVGVTHAELVLETGATATMWFRTNVASAPVNRLLYQKSLTEWGNGMQSLTQGGLLSATSFRVALVDGGRLDSSPASDKRITMNAAFANATFPWRNDNPLDVTNDGVIAPIDALSVINELNGIGARPLGPLPVGVTTIPAFIDSSGDNFVAPIDALLVINHLNSLIPGGEDAAVDGGDEDSVDGAGTDGADGAYTGDTDVVDDALLELTADDAPVQITLAGNDETPDIAATTTTAPPRTIFSLLASGWRDATSSRLAAPLPAPPSEDDSSEESSDEAMDDAQAIDDALAVDDDSSDSPIVSLLAKR